MIAMSRPQCKLSALVVLIAVVQVADGFTAVHLQSCKRIGPGAYPGCAGFVVSSDPRSNLKALCSKHRSLTAPRILVMHASQDDGTREKMASGYLLAGGVTVAAWAACALGALATYKPWRCVPAPPPFLPGPSPSLRARVERRRRRRANAACGVAGTHTMRSECCRP